VNCKRHFPKKTKKKNQLIAVQLGRSFVECELVADGQRLLPPLRTAYRAFTKGTTGEFSLFSKIPFFSSKRNRFRGQVRRVVDL
jgi:hypothetical protein